MTRVVIAFLLGVFVEWAGLFEMLVGVVEGVALAFALMALVVRVIP